jgi:hypothetical protein
LSAVSYECGFETPQLASTQAQGVAFNYDFIRKQVDLALFSIQLRLGAPRFVTCIKAKPAGENACARRE